MQMALVQPISEINMPFKNVSNWSGDRTMCLGHSLQMAEAKHTVADSWLMNDSASMPRPLTHRRKYGIYDRHTVAGSISQSSYQRPTFERRRARKRRETIMSIKDHVNITVPRMWASSTEWVLEVALGILKELDEVIGMNAVVRVLVELFRARMARVRVAKVNEDQQKLVGKWWSCSYEFFEAES